MGNSREIFFWTMLFIIVGTMCLENTFAQQPTATLVYLEGQAVVFDQGGAPVAAVEGMVLSSGDKLETQAGADVVLQLSDGSELELGEHTSISIDTLLQHQSTGARTSRIKLWWGRIRSFLAPGHQVEGSAYEVQTPNALVGVKFSQPDTEVVYDPETNKTLAIAYQFDLVMTNLLTGETLLIPEGQTGVAQGTIIESIPRIVQPTPVVPRSPQMPVGVGPETPQVPISPEKTSQMPAVSPEAQGFSGRTLAAIGLSVAAVTGGVTAFIVESEQNNGDDSVNTSFSGKFVRELLIEPGVTQTVEFHLTQTAEIVQGRRTEIVVAEGCCTATGIGSVNGTIDRTVALLTVIRGAGRCSCSGKQTFPILPDEPSADQRAAQVGMDEGSGRIIGVYWDEEISSGPAILENDGNIFRYGDHEYRRQ